MTAISLRTVNRATLHRQLLLERADAPVADVVGRVAGLQGQHATWPYVALWSRRQTADVTELEGALASKTVVKATVMRTTLHLVDAADVRAFDIMTTPSRLANWQPSASRAGLDLLELNGQVRAYCREPRTLAEIEAHLTKLHPGIRPADHIPGGVRNAWFRLASAGGGLVHASPSGFWDEHGHPRYVDIDVWLAGAVGGPTPTAHDALQIGIERFLSAYGPATVADFRQWSGVRRVSDIRRAIAALGDRIIEHVGPEHETYLDLADLDLAPADIPTSPRLLARWDSLLTAYAPTGRARIVPPDYTSAIYKKNGDVLPTFLVDGMVAGVWSTETVSNRARLHLEPFASVRTPDRTQLTDEAERLVRYIAPGTEFHHVTWAD